jgi:hypothetical protein
MFKKCKDGLKFRSDYSKIYHKHVKRKDMIILNKIKGAFDKIQHPLDFVGKK